MAAATLSRVLVAGAAVVVLAGLWLGLRPRGEAPRTWLEAVPARRGDLVLLDREMGSLSPRDPVIVRCPFSAKLQWIVEDGSWVERGADLFSLSEEDELKRVADLRNQMLQARAELKLSRLKRRHGEVMEGPKKDAADRQLKLAETRHAILVAQPKGGAELVELHRRLAPLAERSAARRGEAETAQDSYQKALDAYLEALDVWQGNRDRIMRAQARLDELDAAPDPGEGPKAEEQRAERTKNRGTAKSDLDSAQAASQGLAAALAQALAERQRLQGPRDAAQAALAAAEEEERPLRFAIEVEKKWLPMARLQLDERGALIDLAETRRKLEETRQAAAAGSVSRAEVERLEDQLRKQENDLAILRRRLTVAARPPDERTLAASLADREQARIAAEEAHAAYDRTIAILDQDVAQKDAQQARLASQIDEHSLGFPSVLEAGIRFAEREVAMLGSDEAEERSEAEARLARLRQQYATAKEAPPQQVKAPIAGVVKVMRNGDRQRQAGDQCWEYDGLVELYPPERMEVLLRIGEVDIGRIHPGQPARVVVPTLKDLAMDAEVAQVAGVGKDKFSRPEYAGKAGFADVVDFDVRLKLKGGDPGFRQGMGVRVEIEIGRRNGVLHLPRGAVMGKDATWQVRLADGHGGQTVRTITGEPFGPEWFVVAGGLAEGEQVLIERTRNR